MNDEVEMKNDIILNAMGNILYYSVKPVTNWKSIQETCQKYNCDGLFFLERTRKRLKLRYFDNDGTENFCGNACRILPLVLSKKHVMFDVVINGKSYSYTSKEVEGEYLTTIKIFEIQRISDKQWFAFVGNRQVVTIVDSLDFDIESESQKIHKRFGDLTCSFVKIVSKIFAEVRVFEENVGETFSCCSSASAVTRTMWDMFQTCEMKLKYRGGTFSATISPNVENKNQIQLRGGCKIERILQEK
jgi:diaminopimelate epimerase